MSKEIISYINRLKSKFTEKTQPVTDRSHKTTASLHFNVYLNDLTETFFFSKFSNSSSCHNSVVSKFKNFRLKPDVLEHEHTSLCIAILKQVSV